MLIACEMATAKNDLDICSRVGEHIAGQRWLFSGHLADRRRLSEGGGSGNAAARSEVSTSANCACNCKIARTSASSMSFVILCGAQCDSGSAHIILWEAAAIRQNYIGSSTAKRSRVTKAVDPRQLVAPVTRQVCPMARLQLQLHAGLFALLQPLHRNRHLKYVHQGAAKSSPEINCTSNFRICPGIGQLVGNDKVQLLSQRLRKPNVII